MPRTMPAKADRLFPSPRFGLQKTRQSAILFHRAAPFLVVLLLWQIAASTGLAPSELLVAPTTVLDTMLAMSANGELVRALGASLYRLAIGFLAGSVAGVLLGLAIGTSRWADRITGPFFHALRQIPVIAFIPMLIMLAGVGDGFKIVAVALAAFFPIALATRDAVRAIPRAHFEVAAVFRLRPAILVIELLFPAIVPGLLTGVRVAVTRAWMVLVAAELMSGDSGLGQMMEMGRQTFRMDLVMVGIVVTGAVGFLLDRSVRLAQARLLRWVPA